MKRLLLVTLLMVAPAQAQVPTFCQSFPSNPQCTVNIRVEIQRPNDFLSNFQAGLEAGRRIRAAQDARAQAQAELEYVRAQAELVRVQTEALRAEANRRISDQAVSAQLQAQAMEWAQLQVKMFAIRHPDYKEVESTMVALATKLKPTDDMNPQDYLEALYVLAKHE